MALNHESANSVMAEPGGNQVPADGTGKEVFYLSMYLFNETRCHSIGSLAITI